MLNTVRRYAPATWDTNSDQSEVPSRSEEFLQTSFEIRQAFSNASTPSIKRLVRVQDLHSYGQFLIKEQLLLNSSSDPLYRVRRYIQVHRMYRNEVIQYNLDPRRCGLGQTISFKQSFNYFDSSQLIVVVKMLTTHPNMDVIQPNNSCDYYVEYIVEVD